MQLFGKRSNLTARITLILVAVLLFGGGWLAYYLWTRSPWITREGQAPHQPIPFSHEHHVRGDGLDCRYCHVNVETAAFAEVPPTQICMNCHTQIWSESPMLAPVRDSWASGEPIRWRRVYDVADFVYFNHSIHIAKGVGCSTCHGRIDLEPLVKLQQPLFMDWCLNCHNQPWKYLRPADRIFDMEWKPPKDQDTAGRALFRAYGIRTEGLTDCVTCHR